jgi:TPR repeat protein
MMGMRIILALTLLVAASVRAESVDSEMQDLATKAAQGDPTAQYNLAVELYRGEKVEKDLERAAELFRSSAASGHVPAHANLAHLVFYGHGLARDPEEGIRLWRFAAERGHAEAQLHLASVYMTGRQIGRDYVLAYAWAKTSVYYAKAAPELGGGSHVAEEASTLMRQARKELGDKRAELAEKRAASFISSYGP